MLHVGSKIVFNVIFYCLYALIVIVQTMMGNFFIYQQLMTIIYCLIFFFLVCKFEHPIDQFILSLTVEKIKAKQQVFIVTFVVLFLEWSLSIVYNDAIDMGLPQVSWIKNYVWFYGFWVSYFLVELLGEIGQDFD